MRSLVVLGLGTLIVGSGCGLNSIGSGPAIVGSGVTNQEVRKVSDFTEVSISDAIAATLSIGPQSSVVLEGDDNLLPFLQTEVKDHRLIVKFVEGQWYRTKGMQKVKIVTPKCDFLEARATARITATVASTTNLRIDSAGASRITVQRVSSDNVEVSLSGASRITLDGSGKLIQIVANGASQFEARNGTFMTAQVKIAGASSLELSVSEKIEGTVSGASSLKALGRPKERLVTISGASQVIY